MPPALSLRNLSKRYATHLAVRDLDLTVPAGTIYGILGPNGAGKSTTIRMAMNIIARDTGDVSLLGADPAARPDVLRRVGYLPEERGLYKKMKVLDVIVFFARLKGLSAAAARRGAAEWIDRMGLGEWRGARVETLSKGMQQKVQFITTVVHAPDLLILDEPASGLDPVNQEVLRETILDVQRQGRTVVFSTHNMDQAEQLCEHVCIIAEGRKVLDGALRAVRLAHAGSRYAVAFDAPSVAAERVLADRRLFSRAEPLDGADGGWTVELAPGAAVQDAVAALNSIDVPLARFARRVPSLHEIFVARVGEASVAHRRPQEVAAHV
jgi:ABC-2 type transport system ATP-binding protein